MRRQPSDGRPLGAAPMTGCGTRLKFSQLQRLRQLSGVELTRARRCRIGRSWPQADSRERSPVKFWVQRS